jgi:hypothetical protein
MTSRPLGFNWQSVLWNMVGRGGDDDGVVGACPPILDAIADPGRYVRIAQPREGQRRALASSATTSIE